jgi:hypothetical protein
VQWQWNSGLTIALRADNLHGPAVPGMVRGIDA